MMILRASVAKRCYSLLFLFLVSFGTISCGASSEWDQYPPFPPKESALLDIRKQFAEAVAYRDLETAKAIMSEDAYQDLARWFAKHPTPNCWFIGDYHYMGIGGWDSEDPVVSTGAAIFADCISIPFLSRSTTYHLEIKKIIIYDLPSGWQIQDRGRILETWD